MGNKNMLLNLLEKNREFLRNNPDYVKAQLVLKKLESFIIKGESDELSLYFDAINDLTDEDLAVFTSPRCVRILDSFPALSSKKGWRIESVIRLIKELEQDIIENKIKHISEEKKELDELYRLVSDGLISDNYEKILNFIDTSVKNDLLTMEDGFALNFYVLRECSINNRILDDELEIVELKINNDDISFVKERLIEIFLEYGYEYDSVKLGDLEDKLLKYVDVDYVSYVLSMFKKYNINNNTLYLRKKTFYGIILDNNRETFDKILEFVDNNDCSLKTLLSMPAIFSKKKRKYMERNKNNNNMLSPDKDLFEIHGVQQDFFENLELYKQLSGTSVIDDNELVGLSKFLCTPSVLVKKNLQILKLYKIINNGQYPRSIVSLCGNSTEYLIDRYIEVGLYEQYLRGRYQMNGEYKEPRGTSYLDRDNNPFRFYKLKRAKDLGEDVFASNAGIKKVFHDDTAEYMGISLVREDDNKKIMQKPLSFEEMYKLRDEVIMNMTHYIHDKVINHDIALAYFENLYKYREVTPIQLFSQSTDDRSILKGERINGLFRKDYKQILTLDDIKALEDDDIISALDNSFCYDSENNKRNVKVSEFKYEFTDYNIPGVVVTISRYKVLRLCKLLKEDGCWINNNILDSDTLNTMMSVLLKDTIISEVELEVLKSSVIEILGSILSKNKRGAR